jgi:DNA polymerase/3'-5' exonuclease PolX
MPVHNRDIAEIFSKVADLLEIEGANQFRVRAYRTAARTIDEQGRIGFQNQLEQAGAGPRAESGKLWMRKNFWK